MPRWLLVILGLVVGFILFSMAAFIALPLILGMFLPGVGTVLVYEMEDLKPNQDPSAIAAKTVKGLDLRLNPGYRRQASVSVIEGNRIEVGVYGNDPATVKSVEELINFTGKLEFRVVANFHKHKQEIEIAQNDLTKDIYYNSKGQWIARWVPLKEGERHDAEVNFVRTRTVKGKEIVELLVVSDPYNITGDYIISARPGSDAIGPLVLVSFSSSGGKLFSALTGDNLPDPATSQKNQLGIILDGVIYAYPNIQSVIFDQAQITGNFTEQEVKQIVDCLNAGSLPVNLRKVEERNISAP